MGCCVMASACQCQQRCETRCPRCSAPLPPMLDRFACVTDSFGNPAWHRPGYAFANDQYAVDTKRQAYADYDAMNRMMATSAVATSATVVKAMCAPAVMPNTG